jgi:hypothetical protein
VFLLLLERLPNVFLISDMVVELIAKNLGHCCAADVLGPRDELWRLPDHRPGAPALAKLRTDRLDRSWDRYRLYRIGRPPTSATCLGVFA